MSKELREFLQWWLKEAESDNPTRRIKYYGLCYNLEIWSNSNAELYWELQKKLGHFAYPFGENNYTLNRWNGTQHKCPRRLAWVKEQLGVV